MFGPISPTVRNLLARQNNEWGEDQFLIARQLSGASLPIRSPSTVWQTTGWSTNNSSAQSVAFRANAFGIQGAPTYGRWSLQYALGTSAFSDVLQWDANSTFSRSVFTVVDSATVLAMNNSSTVDTIQNLNVRSSGTQVHVVQSFGSSIRSSWSTNSTGTVDFRSAGSTSTFNFSLGSSIGSTSNIVQIYGGGIYNYGGSFNIGAVTAGSADTSVQTTLSTYGSFAVRGSLVTTPTYTMSQNETVVYVDPTYSNVCAGSPAACSTYNSEGTCNARSAVGCLWFSGNPCSVFSGDQGACTGQAGCTWEQAPCSSANNTDQSTCESQGSSYGGGCSWDTSTCPSYSSDQTSCEATSGCTWSSEPCSNFNGQSQSSCESNSGCSWAGADCHAFDGTDQSTCESGHTGCSWDSDNSLCNGVYDEASVCSGVYNTQCTGSLCTGTYSTGNCTGTYGAVCQGTATCSLIGNSGTCNSEPGCSWTSGITLTLPSTTNASRGTTGRLYMIQHVGQTIGTVIIQGQSGQPIFQYSSVNLFKPADRVILHNQNISFPCSTITVQATCSAQTGCTWNPAIVCSSFNGDQSACESAGCSWDAENSTCSGAGSLANCSGTYSNGSHWYVHNIDRGYNYATKTADYTLTIIDDIVAVTANNVTLTLPSAVNVNGKEYTLKNLGTGTVTINTSSGETIDGNGSGVLTLAQYDSLTVRSNGSNWIIV